MKWSCNSVSQSANFAFFILILGSPWRSDGNQQAFPERVFSKCSQLEIIDHGVSAVIILSSFVLAVFLTKASNRWPLSLFLCVTHSFNFLLLGAKSRSVQYNLIPCKCIAGNYLLCSLERECNTGTEPQPMEIKPT